MKSARGAPVRRRPTRRSDDGGRTGEKRDGRGPHYHNTISTIRNSHYYYLYYYTEQIPRRVTRGVQFVTYDIKKKKKIKNLI